MIIDDDPKIADLLGNILQHVGIETVIVNDGETGIKRFLDQKPDMVFTDYLMPRIDGIMVLKTVKALQPEIPVILFTGYYEQLTEDLALESIQPDRILRKPFLRIEIVYEAVREFFPELKIDDI